MEVTQSVLFAAAARGDLTAAVVGLFRGRGFSMKEAVAVAFVGTAANIVVDDSLPFLPRAENVVQEAKADNVPSSGGRRLEEDKPPVALFRPIDDAGIW